MNPVSFPEANAVFLPPPGMAESQVMSIPAFQGTMAGGSLDGCPVVVTAWQPTPEELEVLKRGAPVFLSVVGHLPPHFLAVEFPYQGAV